jgi:hypothetical protein
MQGVSLKKYLIEIKISIYRVFFSAIILMQFKICTHSLAHSPASITLSIKLVPKEYGK